MDGDTVKNISLLITTAVALIAIYKWWFPDRPTFGVQVELTKIEIPQPFFDEVSELVRKAERLEHERELAGKTNGLPNVDVSRYRNVRRHITMSITNTGNRPAKQIALQVGRTGFYKKIIKGQDTPDVEFTDRIALNDLSVRETIKIEWWDDGRSPFMGVDTIDICHEDGVQTVKLPRSYSGMFDAYLSQTGVFGFLGILIVALVCLGLLQVALSRRGIIESCVLAE